MVFAYSEHQKGESSTASDLPDLLVVSQTSTLKESHGAACNILSELKKSHSQPVLGYACMPSPALRAGRTGFRIPGREIRAPLFAREKFTPRRREPACVETPRIPACPARGARWVPAVLSVRPSRCGAGVAVRPRALGRRRPKLHWLRPFEPAASPTWTM